MSEKRWCMLVAAILAFAVAAIIAPIVDPFDICQRALFYQLAYASFDTRVTQRCQLAGLRPAEPNVELYDFAAYGE